MQTSTAIEIVPYQMACSACSILEAGCGSPFPNLSFYTPGWVVVPKCGRHYQRPNKNPFKLVQLLSYRNKAQRQMRSSACVHSGSDSGLQQKHM